MSDPSQSPSFAPGVLAFPPAAPPAEGAVPLPPPPAFPTAPTIFDGGYTPAPAAYAAYPQGLTPTHDALVAQTSGLAIASLVCSLGALLGVAFFPLFLACVAGIVCGHLALWRIGHSHGQLKGKGLAIGGLVVGYIVLALLLLVVVVVASIVVPSNGRLGG